jgi:hypothetical protein
VKIKKDFDNIKMHGTTMKKKSHVVIHKQGATIKCDFADSYFNLVENKIEKKKH